MLKKLLKLPETEEASGRSSWVAVSDCTGGATAATAKFGRFKTIPKNLNSIEKWVVVGSCEAFRSKAHSETNIFGAGEIWFPHMYGFQKWGMSLI